MLVVVHRILENFHKIGYTLHMGDTYHDFKLLYAMQSFINILLMY